MNYQIALLDLDLVTYRCGFAVQKLEKTSDTLYVEPWSHCEFNIRNMIRGILDKLDPEQYRGFLTSNDKSNFRFEIFPEYKQHRKKVAKPYYYDQIRDFLVTTFKAEVVSGEEADDRISIEHCKLNNNYWTEGSKNSIIVSIDKDFNNVPGWHYNFVKEQEYFLTEIEALKNFYLQILTGDIADGVPRIKKGWREKEFNKKLLKATAESEMVDLVECELIRISGDLVPSELNDMFTKRGQLLWLRRKEGEIWQIPTT